MKSEIIELTKAVNDVVQLMNRYKTFMAKVFDMLGFIDITFLELNQNPVKIRGVSEITGHVWELPLWKQEGTKINFYCYPELEELYEEHQ